MADHIVPRKHDGEDDLINLQALCFKLQKRGAAVYWVTSLEAFVMSPEACWVPLRTKWYLGG
jgi:hypothetical protein